MAIDSLSAATEQLDWPGWISVNLSARQVAEPGLAATVQSILAGSDSIPTRSGWN